MRSIYTQVHPVRYLFFNFELNSSPFVCPTDDSSTQTKIHFESIENCPFTFLVSSMYAPAHTILENVCTAFTTGQMESSFWLFIPSPHTLCCIVIATTIVSCLCDFFLLHFYSCSIYPIFYIHFALTFDSLLSSCIDSFSGERVCVRVYLRVQFSFQYSLPFRIYFEQTIILYSTPFYSCFNAPVFAFFHSSDFPISHFFLFFTGFGIG